MNNKRCLTIFDLDETLFNTNGKVYVRHIDHDNIVREVDYSLGDDLGSGEYYDYAEFRSAKFFYDTAVPINKMVKKFKAIRSRKSIDSKLCIITARADLDNKDLFLAALDKHGVYYDDVYIHRAGNYEDCAPTTPLRKVFIISKLIDDEGDDTFNKVRMFDDSYKNLKAFLDMKIIYPDIKFEAYHVNHKGQVTRFKNN